MVKEYKTKGTSTTAQRKIKNKQDSSKNMGKRTLTEKLLHKVSTGRIRSITPRKNSNKTEGIVKNVELNKVEEKFLDIYPMKITDIIASKLLNWYAKKLPHNFTKSYCPLEKLIEKSQTGYNPIWLGYGEQETDFNFVCKENTFTEKKIKGLIVIHIDPASQLKPRILILHASILNEKAVITRLPDLLKKLMDYIWKNVNCDEVRVELSHFLQNGKLAPYEYLKTEFQNLKFRWKTLISDQQGNRMVVLGINRPEDKLFDSSKGFNCKCEPITFKHSIAIAVTNKNIKEIAKKTEVKGTQSLCCYLEAMKSMETPSCELIINNDSDDYFIKSLINASGQLSIIVNYIKI